jgi:hypothetical protein
LFVSDIIGCVLCVCVCQLSLVLFNVCFTIIFWISIIICLNWHFCKMCKFIVYSSSSLCGVAMIQQGLLLNNFSILRQRIRQVFYCTPLLLYSNNLCYGVYSILSLNGVENVLFYPFILFINFPFPWRG